MVLFVLGLMNILMTRGTIWLIVLMVGLLGFILTSSVPTWRYLLPIFPILLVMGSELLVSGSFVYESIVWGRDTPVSLLFT